MRQGRGGGGQPAAGAYANAGTGRNGGRSRYEVTAGSEPFNRSVDARHGHIVLGASVRTGCVVTGVCEMGGVPFITAGLLSHRQLRLFLFICALQGGRISAGARAREEPWPHRPGAASRSPQHFKLLLLGNYSKMPNCCSMFFCRKRTSLIEVIQSSSEFFFIFIKSISSFWY